MSAVLNKALANGALSVRKVISGEAIIVFRNPVLKTDSNGVKTSVDIDPVRLSNNSIVNLLGRYNVDGDAIGQSNVTSLVEAGILEIV